MVFLKRQFYFYNFPPIFFIYAMGAGILFEKQSVMSYLVGGFYLIYVLVFNLKFITPQPEDKKIYYYLIFLGILILFSSELLASFKIYSKVVVSFMFFPIANQIVRKSGDFRALNNSVITLMALYLVNLVIANIFNLGGMSYEGEDTLDTGNIYKTGLNAMAYAVVLFPFIYYVNQINRSKIKSALLSLMLITVIITMLIFLRRTPLISIFTGYLVFFIFFSSRNRLKIVFQVLGLFLILYITYPLYGRMFEQRVSAREERFTTDFYETEGRYLETLIVIEEIFDVNYPIRMLFGRELFNSSGNYNNGRWGDRQLHNDYANLLNGSGVFGISFFLFINIIILRRFNYLKLIVKENNLLPHQTNRMFSATFYSVFSVYFAMALGGSIDGMLYEGIRYIYLGAIIGYYRSLIIANSQKLIKST